MNVIKLISLSIFIVSCSSIKENIVVFSEPPAIDSVQTVSVRTGKVVFKRFSFNRDDGVYVLQCGEKKHRFQVKNKTAHIYLPASYFSKAKKDSCTFVERGESEKALTLNINSFDYPKERLNVPKSKVFYSKKDLARIIREKEIKKQIYKTSSDVFLFEKPFKVPLKSYITSHYGNQRLFNDKKKSQHLGNDLRARTGTPIPSANRGRVVYTGNLFFSGNVVVIDHGMDIFSMYGHLSKILVTEGSVVNQGDIVGLAGATGRVSGPHLHWGVRINGSWIDGFSLIEASKKHLGDES
ncbi:MAG: peptidase M23 [Halobacteriovoraceae bacterium]|nr:peptidase M23 [Halobacteriovoraceae bacterium]